MLVRLDPALPEAAVEQARASLLRAEAAATLARSEVERQRELSRQGVASASVLDRAESEDPLGRRRGRSGARRAAGRPDPPREDP